MKMLEKMFRKGQTERRVAQNKKILGEFPWLWAIQDCWVLTDVELVVSNGLNHEFFCEDVLDSIRRSENHVWGVWIYGKRNVESSTIQAEMVVPIWKPRFSLGQYPTEITWGELILEEMVQTEVYNVAVQLGPHLIKVLRPTPWQTFNLDLARQESWSF